MYKEDIEFNEKVYCKARGLTRENFVEDENIQNWSVEKTRIFLNTQGNYTAELYVASEKNLTDNLDPDEMKKTMNKIDMKRGD